MVNELPESGTWQQYPQWWPTLELRWYDRRTIKHDSLGLTAATAIVRVLQQKWVTEGAEEWRDVPIVEGE